MLWLSVAINHAVVADEGSAAYVDAALVLEAASGVDEDSLPEVRVETTVSGEGRKEPNPLGEGRSKQLLQLRPGIGQALELSVHARGDSHGTLGRCHHDPVDSGTCDHLFASVHHGEKLFYLSYRELFLVLVHVWPS
jgi:hypothetical protein